jgi:hypothetical protein
MDSIYKNAISTAATTIVPSSYVLPQPGSTVDKSQQTKTTTKPSTDISIEQLSSDDASYVDSYLPQSSSSSPSLSTSISSESSSSVTIEASGSVKRITNVDDVANDNNDNNIENLNREKQRMRNNELFRCLFIKIVPSTIMHIFLYFRVLFVLIYIFSLYYSAYMIILLIL